jgi:hypothetical protein
MQLLELGDPSHPKVLVTRKNASAILMRIPLEVSLVTAAHDCGNHKTLVADHCPQVRLMIYEYSVALEESVSPRQLAPRSNKFTWGRIDHSAAVLRMPLVVSALVHICRQAYHELRKTPVFYRVNSFKFLFPYDLLAFLAAITPA